MCNLTGRAFGGLQRNIARETFRDDHVDDALPDVVTFDDNRLMPALFGEFELLVLPTAQLAPFPIDWEWPHEIAGAPMERYYTWQRSCIRTTSTAMPMPR